MPKRDLKRSKRKSRGDREEASRDSRQQVPNLVDGVDSRPQPTGPISSYPGRDLGSFLSGSPSTPEVNTPTALADMTQVSDCGDRTIPRTAITSPPPPSIEFSTDHSALQAGRDIGSNNIRAVQQGDGLNIVGEFNQLHIHAGPAQSEEQAHSALINRIKDKMTDYVVPEAQLLRKTGGKAFVCHRDTRSRLLEDILMWIKTDSKKPHDPTKVSEHTWCIEGAPGSGKSTIMNTIIIRLLEEVLRQCPGIITAHYCIRRGMKTTVDADKVLTTLVYQLASRSLSIARRTSELLDGVPHTGVLSSELQLRLFLEAVRAARSKVLVIVDALDESSEPASLTSSLSRIISQPPPNLRLLLATRNEHDVLTSIGDGLVLEIVRSIPTQESYDEVSQFIASRLADGVKMIFGSNPLWVAWPSMSQVQSLSERADGLYIWASTAVDFILSRVRKRGLISRDKWVEEVGRIGQGTKDVDALYGFILRNYIQDDEDDDHDDRLILERTKGVLGFVISAKEPVAIDDIIALLDCEDFDVLRFTELTRSILVPGIEAITVASRLQVHKTFSDYITSDRAAEFRIVLEDVHRTATSRCFSLMEVHLRFNICALRSSFFPFPARELRDIIASIPRGLIYASSSWWYHLTNAGPPLILPSHIRSIQTLLFDKFLFWLEIVSLTKNTRLAAGWISGLGMQLAKVKPAISHGEVHLADFAADASLLMSTFLDQINDSVPHIYISLLALSPWDSAVVAHYRNRASTMVIPPLSEIPWTAGQVNTSTLVWSISFSPCGRLLAASHGESICVWDVETGRCAFGPLNGHSEEVRTVCFSPQGFLIASGSDDRTIRIWDHKKGQCIFSPLRGHEDTVRSLSFSPDGTRIASGSGDCTIRVWDAHTGHCVLGPLKGHNDPINTVSFSPNASYIASGSEDKTIRLWHARSGKSITGPLQPNDSGVLSISFSPNGRQLVSGCSDSALHIWDVESGVCLLGPLIGHTEAVRGVCFSPDGRYIASGSYDRTLRIWDVELAACVAGPIGGATDAILSVAFSPIGEYLAVGSWDGTVRLWDFQALLSGVSCEAGCGSEDLPGHRLTDQTLVKTAGINLPWRSGSWTLGPRGERLLWTPQPFDSAIWRPSTVRILGQPTMLKPDISKLVTGEEWLAFFPNS